MWNHSGKGRPNFASAPKRPRCLGHSGRRYGACETFLETAIRETYEETGLQAENLQLFGLYSGAEGYAEYQNGDQVYSVQIIFHTQEFSGELIQEGTESHEHRFFKPDELPQINSHQERFIMDWVNKGSLPILK
ncbi:NUDIX domain-containing protein [Planococcus sp. A6]|uniref:NUDIX domain-containing protein n=1 Tax=Planococcus sp. A6 TaxID=2992760 RepID=UPI0038B63E66